MSNHSGERAAQRLRLIMIVVILTALALGSFWGLQIMRRGAEDALTARPRSKPDYYVEKFRYVKMAGNGLPRYDITGEKMVHFPVTDSFEVSLPVITSLTREKPPMTLRSRRAMIEDDNSRIHMYEDVHADRAAAGSAEDMHLTTEYLLLLPDDGIAKTDRQVEISMGQSVMTGTGMVINDATQEFQLLHDVRSIYPPHAHRR